jgi:hypothetical protein
MKRWAHQQWLDGPVKAVDSGVRVLDIRDPRRSTEIAYQQDTSRRTELT